MMSKVKGQVEKRAEDLEEREIRVLNSLYTRLRVYERKDSAMFDCCSWSPNSVPLPHKVKHSMCISDYMQITVFYLRRFVQN